MKIVKKLVKQIKSELCDAEKYAECALKQKESDRTLSDTYYSLANAEMEHMERLHAQVVRLIDTYKKSGETVPPAMQAIWDYEHEQIIDEAKEVKVLLSMYK